MANQSNNTSSNRGYVYVLSNPSFKSDIIKIGRTQSLSQRIKQLSGAAVPFDYELEMYLKVSNYMDVETMVHNLLKDYNVSKEFFEISLGQLQKILKKVAKVSGGSLYKKNKTGIFVQIP